MKLLKVSLAILIVLMLTGCKNNEVSTNVNTDNQINTSTNVSNSSNQEPTLSMGSWDGSVYTNDFLDIKYTLPSGWISYTEEEIATLMNIGSNYTFGDDEFLKKISELTTVYYIFTQNPTNNNNVSLFTEKPLVDVTMDYYINQIKTQLSALETINYKIDEVTTGKVGNKDVTILNLSVPDYNLQQRYYIYKLDKYFVGIIVTSSNGEDGINEIISCFE